MAAAKGTDSIHSQSSSNAQKREDQFDMRKLSAGSIFSHYLESRSSVHSWEIDLEGQERKKKWWRCNCCKCCSKKPNPALDPAEDSHRTEKVRPIRGLCCGIFKRRKKHAFENESEMEVWHEDLEKVQHVTSGFRDWLHVTYNRNSKAPARLRKERLKARRHWFTLSRGSRGSVVSVTGLHDEKLIVINELLAGISAWEFDSFDFHLKSDKHSLSFVTKEIFRQQDFLQKFRIKKENLKNLLIALEAGYTMHKNPYHNDRHAADVTQTVYAIMETRPAIYGAFTDIEIFALVFGAMIHDLAHPGTTNSFHVNAQTPLAILYNDRAVLENHHLASAFQILKNPNCNILENFKTEEFKEFRELVIEMVLATDMGAHFANMKTVRSILKSGEWNGTSHKSVTSALSLILHTADIGNPAKPWAVHKMCTDAVLEEFQAQGIKETNLKIPVSPLCDPKDQNAATQITFIEVIVRPTFQLLGDLLDLILSDESDPTIKAAAKNFDTEKRRVTVQLNNNIRMSELDKRRISALPQDASIFERIPSIGSTRAGRQSFFRKRSVRPSKHIDPQVLLQRPWIVHLANNINEWKAIQQTETPTVIVKTTKSNKSASKG